MSTTIYKELRNQHKRNLATMENIGDETKMTKQECLDMMASAISVQDWNALREIVKRDYEFASISSELNDLLYEIDGKGLIVSTLKANEGRVYGEVPADMVNDLDDIKIGGLNHGRDDDEDTPLEFLDDSEG